MLRLAIASMLAQAATTTNASSATKASPNRFIGSTIALWNVQQQRFVRMGDADRQTPNPDTCTDMDKSAVLANPDKMPKSWRWEMFKVVDGGNGTIGLWNIIHKRFVRMPPSLGHMDVSIVIWEPELPDNYGWERFHLIEAPDAPGEFGLWHPQHERFVTMSPDVMWLESSMKRIVFQATRSWPEERFRVVPVDHLLESPEPPGGNVSGNEPLDTDPMLFEAYMHPPSFTPEVYMLLGGMGFVTLCSVVVAVIAVVCACKQRRAAVAKLSSPMPVAVTTAVTPLPLNGVALMSQAERRGAAV